MVWLDVEIFKYRNLIELGIMDAKLLNPFFGSAINVIKTMSMTEVTQGSPSLKQDCLAFGVVTGLIGLSGEGILGNMVLSFDKNSILAIVNRMLGETYKKVDNDVVDAVGELTNMICAGAKKELNELGYAIGMATPVVMTGNYVELTQLGKEPTITLPFTTPEGEFVIETNLAVENI